MTTNAAPVPLALPVLGHLAELAGWGRVSRRGCWIRKHYLLLTVALQNETLSRASEGRSQNKTALLPDILEPEVRRFGFLVLGIFKIRITKVTGKKMLLIISSLRG